MEIGPPAKAPCPPHNAKNAAAANVQLIEEVFDDFVAG
jgi:hypothetical protein